MAGTTLLSSESKPEQIMTVTPIRWKCLSDASDVVARWIRSARPQLVPVCSPTMVLLTSCNCRGACALRLSPNIWWKRVAWCRTQIFVRMRGARTNNETRLASIRCFYITTEASRRSQSVKLNYFSMPNRWGDTYEGSKELTIGIPLVCRP